MMKERSIKVLFIEDYLVDAQIVCELLKSEFGPSLCYGHSNDLLSGIKRLKKEEFDIILLDLSLPDSNGIDTFLKIKDISEHIPIIVVSGLNDENLALELLEKGAQDYLVKGKISGKTLIKTVLYAIERFKLRKEIISSYQSFQNLVDNNADPILVIDQDYKILYTNSAAETLFEKDKKELIGQHFGFPIVSGEATEINVLRTSSDSAIVEMRVANAIWFEDSVFIATLRDLTLHKESKQKIKEERNKAKYYLDILGHDINNKNQAVISYLEIMLKKNKFAEKEKKLVIDAFNAAKDLSRLANNVRRLNEIKEMHFELKDIEIVNLLKLASENIRNVYIEKNIEFNFSFPDEKVIAKGNDLLLDVFEMIIDNAVKFDHHKKISIKMTVRKKEDENCWKIEFIDRGRGISACMKKHIFCRQNLIGSGIYGSGIGLSLVSDVVEKYGGKVWVEDAVKGDSTQGANFVILLPQVIEGK